MRKPVLLSIRAAILASLAALSVSCVTTRKIAYLQDMAHETQIELENRFEAVISPYDELDIYITCFDKDLAAPFNLRNSTVATNGQRNLYYLVDQDGNIELPVLGTIKAAGLTRLQLQEKIKKMLVDGNYLSDPFVMARFQNFKVFFLGSNGGKAVTIQNTKCSTSVSVTKKWFGTVPQDATATICLWGYPQDGAVSDAKALATLAVTASENCESVTQTADGEEWTILFENVPVTNDLDVPLNYYFTELFAGL